MKNATTALVWRALDARVAAAVVTLAGLALLASAMLLSQGKDARALTNCTVDSAEIPLNSIEAEFLTLINQYRADNGKGSLTNLQTLNRAGVWHSADMIAKGYFAHNEPGGRTWSQRMTDCGYPTGGWRGENIAAGFSSASSVFNAWKDSPGHDANMLNSNFSKIGIGKVGSYWNTDFGSTNEGSGGPAGPTNTPSPTKTPTATKTATAVPPTATKTATQTPGGGSGASPTATKTATPANTTAAASPTKTATKTATPANTTAAASPTKTATKTSTPAGGVQVTQGQNLIAWNGANTSPKVVTDAQPLVQTIYGWDPSKKEWDLYDPDVPGYVNSLKTLKTGNAYWFLASGTAQLNID